MARERKNQAIHSIEKEPIIWRDRKRILGMPLSFTVYELSEERLTLRVGFFRTETDELLLYRILDVKLTRTLWQKIFGVGSVALYSVDQSHRNLTLKNIKYSEKVHRLISDMVEKERTEKGMRGREIFGTAGLGDCDHDGDGIPDALQ